MILFKNLADLMRNSQLFNIILLNDRALIITLVSILLIFGIILFFFLNIIITNENQTIWEYLYREYLK